MTFPIYEKIKNVPNHQPVLGGRLNSHHAAEGTSCVAGAVKNTVLVAGANQDATSTRRCDLSPKPRTTYKNGDDCGMVVYGTYGIVLPT